MSSRVPSQDRGETKEGEISVVKPECVDRGRGRHVECMLAGMTAEERKDGTPVWKRRETTGSSDKKRMREGPRRGKFTNDIKRGRNRRWVERRNSTGVADMRSTTQR